MKCKFNGTECDVVFDQYANNRTAIVLKENGLPFATATFNDPEISLDDNQVLVKNWSENRGMVDSLVDAGIVEKASSTYIPIGPFDSEAWVCNILVENKAQ
jgi:hypothetical protein